MKLLESQSGATEAKSSPIETLLQTPDLPDVRSCGTVARKSLLHFVAFRAKHKQAERQPRQREYKFDANCQEMKGQRARKTAPHASASRCCSELRGPQERALRP